MMQDVLTDSSQVTLGLAVGAATGAFFLYRYLRDQFESIGKSMHENLTALSSDINELRHEMRDEVSKLRDGQHTTVTKDDVRLILTAMFKANPSLVPIDPDAIFQRNK